VAVGSVAIACATICVDPPPQNARPIPGDR
jgi:hypothetical protein